MVNLRTRSLQKELLDGKDIHFEDIKKNMQELNTINRFLGGHKITQQGLAYFLKKHDHSKVLHVCEIGCGGGDNLMAIARYCRQHKFEVRFTGIDIKPACIEFACKQYPQLMVEWIVADYASLHFADNEKPDIIFASLFCHHFTNPQVADILRWMHLNAKTGFFINDLHRHVMAYWSIKWLTVLFSHSYLVKNDAPLSVARGFTKMEWLEIWKLAELGPIKIYWKWAFRHLLIGHAQKKEAVHADSLFGV